jgi:hypothetical protein
MLPAVMAASQTAGPGLARRNVRATPAPTFTGYADFTPAFNEARWNCAAVYGDRWDLHPHAYIWARLPVEWVCVRVAGRNRWSKAPRDQKLPVARFWPNGELPVGPEYEAGAPITKPSKPPVHHAEPEKRRRPSGVNLPSGYEQAEDGFYIEPRWIVDSLLDVESIHGSVHDPFCGGGNIVGACLQRSLSATGSDLRDRGFGERCDAFSIVEPLDNLISNPPFTGIERAVRHFRSLVQRKLVLLARLNILEGQERLELFREHPPARVWVSSRRASIPPGHLQHPRDQFGAVVPLPASGGSTAYCWVVWDKEHVGPPALGWL